MTLCVVLMQLMLRQFRRPIVSFVVGGSMIALLGAYMLHSMVSAGINRIVAYSVQLFVTLVLNFLYNRQFTWRGGVEKRLRRQIKLFVTTRAVTIGGSLLAFPWLLAFGMQYQIANVLCLIVSIGLNYLTSKRIFSPTPVPNFDTLKGGIMATFSAKHRKTASPLAILLLIAVCVTITIVTCVIMTSIQAALLTFFVGVALFNLVMSSMEVCWRLDGWQSSGAREAKRFPEPMTAAQAELSFALIIAAYDEAEVISETLERLVRSTYDRFRIYVSLRVGDDATIAEVRKVQQLHPGKIVVVDDSYDSKDKKPAQLNRAMLCVREDIVGVFDAEDDVSSELIARVAAAFIKTDADIVQGGVQLMNTDRPHSEDAGWLKRRWNHLSGWYCVHNVLEYFFWFSSRMFFQVKQGVVPLGGNTVFIRRVLIEQLGGWRNVLTEDCDMGMRAAAFFGAKVVAFYEPQFATREETPGRLIFRGREKASTLVTQRVRWNQGFKETYLQGDWLKLPTRLKRLMASYILGMPFIQAFNGLMLPCSIMAGVWLVGPVGLVMLMYTPLIPVFMTLVLQIIGLREFARDYKQKLHLRHYVSLVVGYYPYQLVLAWAAIIAIWRLIVGRNDWVLTSHAGFHRTSAAETVHKVSIPEGGVA